MSQSGELAQVPERISGGRGLHGFSLGWVQKDETINFTDVSTQAVVALSSAEAELRGSNEGKSRSPPDDGRTYVRPLGSM